MWDGFHLVGAAVPSDLVAGDELLCEVKIISSGFDVQKIYRGKEPQRRTLAASSGEFMGTARRFLKGNEDQVAGFIWHNPAELALIAGSSITWHARMVFNTGGRCFL